MAVFLIAIFLGVIPAVIASKKGRSVFLWWLYGSALFIIALPHAFLMSTIECPYCSKLNKPDAMICRNCQKELDKHPLRQCHSCRRHFDIQTQFCPYCQSFNSEKPDI